MTGEFWQTWGDGQAEVAAYSLTMPKDGQLRKGTCVVITVIEPFSKSLRVKAEDGKHSKTDVAPTMKMNLLRDYQTGVSNCRDMLSAWTWLEEGMPARISYSSQEWSGQVWSQLVWGKERIAQVGHSYFDGEADRQRSLNAEHDGISEDGLLLVSRRIGWPRLRLGQTYTASVLTSLETERAKHVGLTWSKVEMSLGKDRETVIVPAGRYRTNPFRAKWPDSSWKLFDVEADAPNRVVRWTSSEGEKAELTGITRVKHWQINGEGGEKALETLGLNPVTALRR